MGVVFLLFLFFVFSFFFSEPLELRLPYSDSLMFGRFLVTFENKGMGKS